MVKVFGGKCMIEECKKKSNLEFAHKEINHVSGIGRGSFIRIKNVMENPDIYYLLCKKHHLLYDKEQRCKD